MAIPIALAQTAIHDQPFGGHGAWAWLVFAAPGFLFLIGWAGERRHAHAPHAHA